MPPADQVPPECPPLAPPQTPFVVVIAGFALVQLVQTTQPLLYKAVAPFQAPTSIFRDHWFSVAQAVTPLQAFPFLCSFPVPDIVSCANTLYQFEFNICPAGIVRFL